MKKTIIILTLLVFTMSANALTLEECVLRGSSPRGIGAMQPSKSDGRYFYRMSDDGNVINRISYAKGDESILVDTSNEMVTGWDDFEVTADGATCCYGTTLKRFTVTASAPTTTSMI